MAGMHKNILYLLFLFLTGPGLIAQEADTGKIVIKQDPDIQKLIERHKELNKEKGTIRGYRIQIASDSKREPVYETKAKFLQNYSDLPVYLTYQQPYFKIRVGDFKNRLQALKCQDRIKKHFPGAFIVPDEVKIVLDE